MLFNCLGHVLIFNVFYRFLSISAPNIAANSIQIRHLLLILVIALVYSFSTINVLAIINLFSKSRSAPFFLNLLFQDGEYRAIFASPTKWVLNGPEKSAIEAAVQNAHLRAALFRYLPASP